MIGSVWSVLDLPTLLMHDLYRHLLLEEPIPQNLGAAQRWLQRPSPASARERVEAILQELELAQSTATHGAYTDWLASLPDTPFDYPFFMAAVIAIGTPRPVHQMRREQPA